ncbi:MAG: OmpA family protein [Bacteroidales bacterium]|nr:OmpA family protein [Bacteroidales bacterium]
MAACFLFCFFRSNEITLAGGDTIKIMSELKRNAANSYKRGDVFSAIEYYDRYIMMNKDDMKSLYRLALLYHSTRNYVKARECFNTLIDKASDKYKKAWYYHGIVSMNLEDYATARESFTVFRKKYRKKRDPEGLRRMTSNYIESADWALSHPGSNESITIQHLDSLINGPHIEFSPFPVSANKILYGTYVRDSLHPERGVRQLFMAVRESGSWKPQGLLEGPVNNPDYNTGNAVISDDGQRMYFTRSRRNWQNREISELYISHYRDGHWQQPEKLPYPVNIENYTSTQPALGKNLRTGHDILYFVSDRPGSKGGLDIWYTQKDRHSDVYREPRNPGRNINSFAHECCPFYDLQTRTLYFSSAGKNGYGGFDVYSVTGSGSRWTDAVNIGKPINTSYDDMFFTVTGSGREGFFTSNRPGSLSMDNGSCCDDIFHFYRHECTRVTSYGIVYSSSNYDLVEELNEKYHLNLEYPNENEHLPNIPVSLYQIGNEPATEILIARTKTDEEGKYAFSLETGKHYKIVVKNYGFFDKVITLSTEQSECDDTLIISETGINYLPEITVRFNVYYEHDKYRLTPEARTVIDTSLLPLIDFFPNAVIEIGSHTDSTGSDDYNIRLSQRRSESVVRYLENKGIPGTRLQAKGYGEGMPIAPNSKPDGTDNPEGRQLNRRTELKIVGESNLFYDDE